MKVLVRPAPEINDHGFQGGKGRTPKEGRSTWNWDTVNCSSPKLKLKSRFGEGRGVRYL